MHKRFLLFFLVVVVLSTLLYIGCSNPIQPMSGPVPSATDWFTGNEVPCCPGDWDEVPIFDKAIGVPGYVTRTTAFVYEGTYSYEHFSQADAASCWSFTMISCTVPATHGYIQASVYISGNAEPGVYPGSVAEYQHDMIAVGTFGGYQAVTDIPIWYDYLSIYFDYPEKRAYLECEVCDPTQRWPMGNVSADRWYQYAVGWNLTEGMVGTGWITVTQDATTWVAATGLDTVSGAPYFAPTAIGVGVQHWHAAFSDFHYIYLDDISIYGCDEPFPTPTPVPECAQYGHAAVLNVDSNCEAVLRFRTMPSYIPGGAVVTRATLRVYGVASEELGETVYVTPLNALWGEMTTNWCRRLVGANWTEPGAYDVPLDREAGTIANFQTALGWIDIELPLGLVEEWALTGEANPGLIFHNVDLTGKFSIASREWHVEDYAPHIDVWYTQ